MCQSNLDEFHFIQTVAANKFFVTLFSQGDKALFVYSSYQNILTINFRFENQEKVFNFHEKYIKIILQNVNSG